MLFLIFSALALAASAQEAEAPSTSTVMPAYVALMPNVNDFNRFADGGPDANWYVGFNNAWIVKLPAAPAGDFSKVFIGAKLGRAKTRPKADKPWLREVIPGKVYMALSQTPAFTAEQSFFLAEAADLPLEPDPQNHVDGVGASDWYWTEVPAALVSYTRPNYLIVYSPTKAFSSAKEAPILAGASAEAGAEARAWNNHSISGVPPRSTANSLETPLTTLSPALAIKLIPSGESEVAISEFAVRRDGKKGIAQFSVAGDDVQEAWVESSRDQLEWQRVTKIQRRQPFIFTIAAEKFPAPGGFLRGAARDASGNLGTSPVYSVPYAAR
jgi:hypothetical protein